ncbi:site-specific DNA-methyltransferase [Janthinobacterium sp.]|uniref:site-specific DNA-methyltransferase n=1 Tax=Janthinobacterium sp. TaxID=1871054 RepID=UPI00344C79E1
MQRLELNWIGKNIHPRLEPRILVEDTEQSYHANKRISGDDIFDNRLIYGDNLLALKALEQEFTGKIKCVFIDPPYNTGSAFSQYDDGLEHSIWLGLMRDRLEIIKKLMTDDGSLWITIDDNESHYLKVVCDEIFGRANFISNVVWQKKYTIANDAKWLSDNHDHILIYAKSKDRWRPNKMPRTDEMNARYKNPDKHPKGAWKATPLHAKSGSDSNRNFSFTFKNGLVWSPPPGTFPRFSEQTLRRLDEGDEIWFGKDGGSAPSRKTFLSELTEDGTPCPTVWLHTEAGHNHEAREEVKSFNVENPFDTPKPERLLHRVIHLATQPGDLVLDSFAGSGTTGAVAHKMGRRWIMVELGNHCYTHVAPRMRKVIDGEDPNGVTRTMNWQGGGGFRYYKLAPSLIVKDRWGNPVVNPEYNATQLAAALCKLEGFNYAPSETRWWQQGHSSERDFLFVTTQNFSADQLQALSDEVGGEQSLLVCCAAFHGVTAATASERWPNLTLKRIPKMVLARCEWGHDDYSLNVANLPVAQFEKVDSNDGDILVNSSTLKKAPQQDSLFGENE